MRINLILILILLTSGQSYSQQTVAQRKKLEAKYGVRDIKLDTHISIYDDLVLQKPPRPCNKTYKRSNENPYIAGIEFIIFYGYVDDKLENITLAPLSQEDVDSFIKLLKELYGAPKISKDNFGKVLEWFGYSMKISINYEYGLIHYTKLSYESRCKEINRRIDQSIHDKNKADL